MPVCNHAKARFSGLVTEGGQNKLVVVFSNLLVTLVTLVTQKIVVDGPLLARARC